jgi:hypothetical protein
MKILVATVTYFAIDEDKLTEEILLKKLIQFPSDTIFYVPEYEKDGNPHHNLVHETVRRMTDGYFKTYKTYSGLEDRTIGKEIIPTEDELSRKERAMLCYQTQINNPNTKHYFNAITEYE